MRKYKILSVALLVLMLMPLAYAENDIIIGKGDWMSGDEDGKLGFFIIKEDGEVKRAFFKFLEKGNWIAVDLDKWTENGGMIMNNNGDMAMIVLEDGNGEFHIHDMHDEEYTFTYTIIEMRL